jgi:hypothetical protein
VAQDGAEKMLTALVLVCSIAATPDIAGCNRENALMVMPVPDEFGSPASCLLEGQAYLAQTALGDGLGPDEQVKVVCVRNPTRLAPSAG